MLCLEREVERGSYNELTGSTAIERPVLQLVQNNMKLTEEFNIKSDR
jgi:hypothetical protein